MANERTNVSDVLSQASQPGYRRRPGEITTQHRNTTSRKRHKSRYLDWAALTLAHSRDFETKEEQALALLFPRTKAMMHAGRQAGVEELVIYI